MAPQVHVSQMCTSEPALEEAGLWRVIMAQTWPWWQDSEARSGGPSHSARLHHSPAGQGRGEAGILYNVRSHVFIFQQLKCLMANWLILFIIFFHNLWLFFLAEPHILASCWMWYTASLDSLVSFWCVCWLSGGHPNLLTPAAIPANPAASEKQDAVPWPQYGSHPATGWGSICFFRG